VVGLSIELLGPPAVDADGVAIRLPDRKTWGLLAYLLVAERPTSRTRLAEFLYPEVADPLAAVRWALTHLRRSLGDGAEMGGDPVTIRLSRGAVVDVHVLTRGRWSEAAGLPTIGLDLLDGLAFDSTPAFELWLTGERRRLRAASAAVLHEAALANLARDPAAAVVYAERLVELEPLDENHHVLLVRALMAGGRRDEARDCAAACGVLLQHELGIEPTRALREACTTPTTTNASHVTSARILARIEAGDAAVAAGSWSSGIELLRTAVVEARRLHDTPLLSRCLVALGSTLVHAAKGFDEEGAASLREGGDLAEACGETALAATAWRELAWVEFLRARYQRTARWLERARGCADVSAGDRAWIALIAGAVASDAGDYPAAQHELDVAVDVAEGADLVEPAAFARSFLGRIHLLRGDLDEARGSLTASIATARKVGWTSMVPWPEALLGDVELRDGRVDAAFELFEHAFMMGREIGDPCWESMGARGLGLVAVERGELDGGISLLEDAPRICRRLPDTYLWVEAYALEALCAVAVEHGLPSAPRWVGELERLAAACGFRELTVRALMHRARLGEPGAHAAARAAGEDVLNPALQRILTAHS
jgi:DNA-binding SARP family transcriptional activator